MKRAALALALALPACGDDGGSAPADAAPDTAMSASWTEGAPVAAGPIQETAAVALAGKVYVIGGFLNGGITDRVLIYDVSADTWSDGPALPRALHHANAATDGTNIYVLGGLINLSFTAIGDVYRWAPASETQWTARAAMPAGRERGSAVVAYIDGLYYVAGGSRGGATTQVDVYDPGANSWSQRADLPAPRDHACGGAIAGALIVAGGRTSLSAPQPDTWSYDPALDAWTPRAPMPTGRAGTACGVIGGKLYVAGGEGNAAAASGVFPQVEAFDPAANAWTTHAPMPRPKHGVAGATWDGSLYLCGGADRQGFGAVATTDIFTP